MDDCVHLRACRRIQKMAKTRFCGMHIARKCSVECSCYETAQDICERTDNYYSISEVQKAIDGATQSALCGYTDNIVSDYLRVK